MSSIWFWCFYFVLFWLFFSIFSGFVLVSFFILGFTFNFIFESLHVTLLHHRLKETELIHSFAFRPILNSYASLI